MPLATDVMKLSFKSLERSALNNHRESNQVRAYKDCRLVRPEKAPGATEAIRLLYKSLKRNH